MIKIGDLLCCKKEFESLWFKSGNYYKVMWMNSEYIFLSGDGINDIFDIKKYPIHRNIIPEFFYTKSEMRKIKLEKLNG